MLKEILRQTNQIGHAHTRPIRERLSRMARSDEGYATACREFHQSVRVARGKEARHLKKVLGGSLYKVEGRRDSTAAFHLADTPGYEIWVNRRVDPRSGVRYVAVYDADGKLVGRSHSETGGVMGGALIGMIILQEHGMLDESWIRAHLQSH